VTLDIVSESVSETKSLTAAASVEYLNALDVMPIAAETWRTADWQ